MLDIKKNKVEGFKLTEEQRAFLRNYKKIIEVKKAIQKGIVFQAGKLKSLQAIADEVNQREKTLIQMAPQGGVLEAADEGMVKEQTGG